MSDQLVTLEVFKGSIGIVCLQNKADKNCISAAFQEAILDTFAEIGQRTDLKAVVVHGYDDYFCCGGTADSLREFSAGKISYGDLFPAHRVFLDCELPVVCAMQGHAIGGGLPMSCYGDILILSESSTYSANFMGYGFTPGAGSTYIIPRKFGMSLGNEMLLSAQNYKGSEIKERSAGVKVLPQGQVIEHGIDVAKKFTLMPTVALKLLKARLAAPIKEILPSVIAEEERMQQISFNTEESKALLNQFLPEDE